MRFRALAGGAVAAAAPLALGTTIQFFSASQSIVHIEDGQTWDTYLVDGYLFTATRDKLFTGGIPGGDPIGRDLHFQLPDGLEAQALTELPPGQTDSKGEIFIRREDGQVFDLTAFTMTLVWHQTNPIETYFEIMPILNDEDGLPDPLLFNGTGHFGDEFTYNENTVPSTALLRGYDAYRIKYLLDFAMTSLTLDGPGGCNAADQAEPFGVLDFSDVVAFLSGFGATAPAADLAAPFGQWDFSDVLAFLIAFGAGCP